MSNLAYYFAAFAICSALFFAPIAHAVCTDTCDMKKVIVDCGAKIINVAQEQTEQWVANLRMKLDELKNIDEVVVEIQVSENIAE